jgi:hypothetical protein
MLFTIGMLALLELSVIVHELGHAFAVLLYTGLLISIVAAMWALWRYCLFFCRACCSQSASFPWS